MHALAYGQYNYANDSIIGIIVDLADLDLRNHAHGRSVCNASGIFA